MYDGDDDLVGMIGRDPLDATADPVLELVGRFAAGDDVPPLLDVHQLGDRITVGDAAPELATFPVAEEHLAQVGHDDRCQAEAVDEWLGRLHRSLQGGDVHGGDAFTGVDQPLRREFGLLDATGCERWIAMTVDEVELLALDVRGGFAVAHQQNLRGAGGWGETGLGESPWFDHAGEPSPAEIIAGIRRARLEVVKQLNSRPIDVVDLLSVPAFIGTMAWEARVLARRTLRDVGDLDDATAEELSDPARPPDPLVPVGYERRDTTASLSMLVGNVAVNLAVAGGIAAVNRFVFRRRIADLGATRWSLPVAMVAWDFLYYWDHRWMHEVRLFWANHVSHHSSERYNLSTALRQPWSGFLTSWVFLPMPLLGIPAHHVIKAGQLNLLYQYWIHTEAIDRLPRPIEAVFNTPSHHRVHHGSNPQYLDRNYGGILIVWDKLFGTFEPEVRRIRYGLTANIHTFNPARIAYHEFVDIARDVRDARSWRHRLRYVFGRPGWHP